MAYVKSCGSTIASSSSSWPTTWGAAKKGLAALKIEWDEGPLAKLTTD